MESPTDNLNLVEVPRDGSCLIHSVLYFLDGPVQASPHRILEVRKMIADHFIENEERFKFVLDILMDDKEDKDMSLLAEAAADIVLRKVEKQFVSLLVYYLVITIILIYCFKF
jgi:hypothetical protein